MSSKHIIFLLGPTASGKSELAIQLAQALNGEIISVDSMAIYRGMDIGTAKPDAAARKDIPHHLIDICEPTYAYSAAEFCRDAKQAVADIQAAGRMPILCGGTMFYFHALQHGLSPLPPKDPVLREQIQKRLSEHGAQALHEWLEELDEQSAKRIHPNDSQRLQRAIEICLLIGKPMSKMQAQQAVALDGTIHRIAIDVSDRNILRQRIEQRFLKMLEEGICEEMVALLLAGRIDHQCNAMRGVGYRQIWQYLAGKISYQEMRQKAISASHQLAKRQITWMRKMDNFLHYHTDITHSGGIAENIARQIEKIATKE